MSKPTLKEAIAALQAQLDETRAFLVALREVANGVKWTIDSPPKGSNIKQLKDRAIGIGVQASWWKSRQVTIERELKRKCAIRDKIFENARQQQLAIEAAAAVKQTMAALNGQATRAKPLKSKAA